MFLDELQELLLYSFIYYLLECYLSSATEELINSIKMVCS